MSTPAVGQQACTVRQGQVNGTRHILRPLTLYTKNPSVLLQRINRVCQGLLVRLDVAPDVTVALMTGRLTGIMHPFGLGELAQKSMPQHVWGDINFLILGEVGIGLSGDTADDAVCFTARELSASARQKEGRGVVLVSGRRKST